MKFPTGSIYKDGKFYNGQGRTIELYDGQWCEVKNEDRQGWFRYHERYSAEKP